MRLPGINSKLGVVLDSISQSIWPGNCRLCELGCLICNVGSQWQGLLELALLSMICQFYLSSKSPKAGRGFVELLRI